MIKLLYIPQEKDDYDYNHLFNLTDAINIRFGLYKNKQEPAEDLTDIEQLLEDLKLTINPLRPRIGLQYQK